MNQFIESRIKRLNRNLFILLCVELSLFVLFVQAAWKENFQGAFTVLAGLFLVSFIITLIIYKEQKAKPENHPIYKSLIKFGEVSRIIEEIENEYKNSNSKWKTASCYILPSWLIIEKFFKTDFIPTNEIIWVYKSKTKWRVNFTFVGYTYRAKVCLNDRTILSLGITQSEVDEIILCIYRSLPWIEIGYDEEKESLIHSHKLNELISKVENRKKQILESSKFLRESPDLTITTYQLLGEEKNEAGEFVSAKIFLSKVIELDNSQLKAYRERGYAKFKTEDYNSAIDDYNRYIGSIADDINAHYFRGLCYLLTAQNKLALQDLDKTVQLNPESAAALYWRGNCKMYLKDRDGAYNDLTKASDLGNKSAKDLLEKKFKNYFAEKF